MSNLQDNPQDTEDKLLKEKLNLIFTELSHDTPNIFYKENAVICQPNAIWDIFYLFDFLSEQQKIEILSKLIEIVQKVSQNAIILVSQTKKQMPNNQKLDLIEFLIQMLISKYNPESKVIYLMLEFVFVLMKYNKIQRSNVYAIYQVLSKNFYEQQVSYDRLFISTKILQNLFHQQYDVNEQEGQNYFYFVGKGSALVADISKQQIPWIFSEGMAICLWFYIENVNYAKFKDANISYPKLFTIHCSDSGGGGLEAYFVGNQLYIRILPQKYSDPNQGSNGIMIGDFEPRTWYFLGLDQEGHNLFTHSHVKIVINSTLKKTSNLEIPKINKSNITTFSFGENFIGKIGSVMIFNSQLNAKMQHIQPLYPLGIQNSNTIKNLGMILDKSFANLQILLTPIRSCGNNCYDLINNYIFEFQDKAGYILKDHSQFNLHSFGGINGFCKINRERNIVNELIKLIVIIFKKRADNQQQAVQINFFTIIANLLSELEEPYFDSKTIENLNELKSCIVEPKLLDQFFVDFLWNQDLLDLAEDHKIKNEMLNFILSIYRQSPVYFNSIFGIKNIIDRAMSKCDAQHMKCCATHSLALGLLSREEKDIHFAHPIQQMVEPLFNIVENIFMQGEINAIEDMNYIINCFSLKCSPCFHIQLFLLLKKVLMDRSTKSEVSTVNQVKKMVRSIIDNKGIYYFLHLLSNSPCVDIKSWCVKFINFFIKMKTNVLSEFEISTFISSIFMHLNSLRQISSTFNTPCKNIFILSRVTPELIKKSGQKQQHSNKQQDQQQLPQQQQQGQQKLLKQQSLSDNATSKQEISFFDVSTEQQQQQSNQQQQPQQQQAIQKQEEQNETQQDQKQMQTNTVNKNQHDKLFVKESSLPEDLSRSNSSQMSNANANNFDPQLNYLSLPNSCQKIESVEMLSINSQQCSIKLEEEAQSQSEEENKDDEPCVRKQNKSKSKFNARSLPILDVNQINEMFDCGGEHGRKIQSAQDILKEEDEINDLARKCVRYMNGDLQSDDDCIKKMDLLADFTPTAINLGPITTKQVVVMQTKQKLGESQLQQQQLWPNLTIQDEQSSNKAPTPVSLKIDSKSCNTSDGLSNSQDASSGMQISQFNFNNKLNNSLSPLRPAPQPVEEQKKMQSSARASVGSSIQGSTISEQFDFEPLYISVMEWILNKMPISPTDTFSIIEKDKVNSNHMLHVLMTLFATCEAALQSRIMHDLFLLVKWSPENQATLLNYYEFYYWLLDILLEQQITFFYNDSCVTGGDGGVGSGDGGVGVQTVKNYNSASLVWDFGLKIHSVLLKQALLTQQEGERYINNIFLWLRMKAELFSDTEYQRDFEVSSRYMLRAIWSSLLDSLGEDVKAVRPNIQNNLWKNLSILVNFSFQIVLSMHNYPEHIIAEVDENEEKKERQRYYTIKQYVTQINNNLEKKKFEENVKQNQVNEQVDEKLQQNKIPSNMIGYLQKTQWLDEALVKKQIKLLEIIWKQYDTAIQLSNQNQNQQQSSGQNEQSQRKSSTTEQSSAVTQSSTVSLISTAAQSSTQSLTPAQKSTAQQQSTVQQSQTIAQSKTTEQAQSDITAKRRKSQNLIAGQQNSIKQLLSFQYSSELQKDYDILFSEHSNDAGPIIKIINLLLTCDLDLALEYRKNEKKIKKRLLRIEQLIKYLLILGENCREQHFQAQKNKIEACVLFLLNYLYVKLEELEEQAKSAQQTNQQQQHQTLQMYLGLLRESINSVLQFVFLIVSYLITRLGHFNDYLSSQEVLEQQIAEAEEDELSVTVPSLNLTTYQIFHFHLLDQNSNTIGSEQIIQSSVVSGFNEQEFGALIFSDRWRYAFTQSQNMHSLIDKYYKNNFTRLIAEVHLSNIELAEMNITSFKMNEQNKDAVIKKFDQEIFESTLKLLDSDENQRKRAMQINEEQVRTGRNLWKKMWRRLRLFQGPWRHDKLYQFAQINTLCNNVDAFKYENLVPNDIFIYKVLKYEAKNRARPFMKLTLKEPLFVTEYLENSKKINKNAQSSKQILQYSYNKNQQQQASQNKSKSQNALLQNRENLLFAFGKGLGNKIQSTFKSIIMPSSKSNANANSFQTNQTPPSTHKAARKGSQSNPQSVSIIQGEVLYTTKCQWVKTLTTRNGTLNLTSDKLVFQYDQYKQPDSHIAYLAHQVPYNRRLVKEWYLDDFKKIFLRRYVLRNTAIEIFFVDGFTVYLNFPERNRDQFLQKLFKQKSMFHSKFKNSSVASLEVKKQMEKSQKTKKWLNHQISTFDYLMHLNSLASRSYKDIAQYHVFPWIFNDYSNQTIDLNQERFFRCLSKSMGALGSEERVKTYIERYNSMDDHQGGSGQFSSTSTSLASQSNLGGGGSSSQNNTLCNPSFHFGSHYSSAAIVNQFLIRISPFTEGARILQSGKFDIPDRLFFSIEDSFKCATEEIADVRELIPEFFCFAEMFFNFGVYDFGKQQTGLRVHNVKMPAWCGVENNPFLFIYYQRKGLESDIASAQIHQWIDLIFGYKQQGKEAEKNLNIFYYLTYENAVDLDSIEDESIKISMETQIINFGQTPPQLFVKPHPARIPREQLSSGQSSKCSNVVDINCFLQLFTPTGKKKPNQNEVNYQKQKLTIYTEREKAIVKLTWLGENKLIGLRNNGQITQYRWVSNPVNQNMAQFVPFQFSVDKEKSITIENKKFDRYIIRDRSIDILDFPACFLNNCKFVLIGGYWDGIMKLIQVETDLIIEEYKGHQSTVTAMALEPKKQKFLITGSKTGDVIVWKVNEPNCQLVESFHYFDHDSEITSISISTQLRVFATASRDCSINIYNLYNGIHYRTIIHPSNLPVNQVILGSSPIACVVFFSSEDKSLYTYTVNGQIIQKHVVNFRYLISPFIIQDYDFSDIIVYSNEKGQINFLELPFLTQRGQQIQLTCGIPIISIVVSNDKKFLLCGCNEGDISILTNNQQNQ